MRITGKDLAATVFTGLVVVVYVAYRQGADVPLIASVRGTAGVVLVLGWVGGCALSSVGQVYSKSQRLPTWIIAGLSLLGLVALAAGVVALVTASEVALAVMVGATVLLWALSTIRHMFRPAVALPPQPAHVIPEHHRSTTNV